MCLDPLRVDWTGVDAFECDECAGDECCVMCGESEETDDNPIIICDDCEEYFHLECIDDEADRPPREEIGNDEIEWLCPECYDDAEWAEDAVVSIDDQTANDAFTTSACTCDTCASMNEAHTQWDAFEPVTQRQVRLKEVIDKFVGVAKHEMDTLSFQPPPPPSSTDK